MEFPPDTPVLHGALVRLGLAGRGMTLGGIGLVVRIRAEERQLSQALGEEYEQFAASRKHLVPGVF